MTDLMDNINEDNSYLKYKYDSQELIDELNKMLGGFEFQDDGTWVQNPDKRMVSDWARNELISLVQPYTSPTTTLSVKTAGSVSKECKNLHIELYSFLAVNNIVKAGIAQRIPASEEEISKANLVVLRVMTLVNSNLSKSIGGRFLMSDRTTIGISESKSEGSVVQQSIEGRSKGRWG